MKTENPIQTFQRIKTLASMGYSLTEQASFIGISVSTVLTIRATYRDVYE